MADKGVAMVIMDRHDYINKANQLLNQNTYRSIAKDPTNSLWCGQGACQNPKTIGWQVPTPHC